MTAHKAILNIPSKLQHTMGSHPLARLQREMNRLFHSYFDEMSLEDVLPSVEEWLPHIPATEIAETDKEFRITAELPGMNAKDIGISLSNGYITLTGEKKEEHKDEKKDYFSHERSYGKFRRVIALPEKANVEKAEATFDKGVLTISMSKKEGAEQRERTLHIKQAA